LPSAATVGITKKSEKIIVSKLDKREFLNFIFFLIKGMGGWFSSHPSRFD
jgi:hypothetical protein